MNSPDIAIIINSFDRLQLLKKCLGAFSWLPGSVLNNRCAAVIFDAGSTDGSLQWLNDNIASCAVPYHVIVPKPGDDTSFSAGINVASAYALQKFPALKYLLFYETDNQILEDLPILQALDQLASDPSLAACGFTVRQEGGSPAGVGMPFPSLFNFLLGKNLVHKFQLEAIPYKWHLTPAKVNFSLVDIVFTSPLLMKLEAWQSSGGFDAEAFPFSDCDIDWARKLKDKGWYMGVISSDAVIHDNLSAISSWSRSRAIQFHRARLRYFMRYHPVKTLLIWPVPLLFRHTLELVSVKLFVKDKVRRQQLSDQFVNLFRSCLKRYQ